MGSLLALPPSHVRAADFTVTSRDDVLQLVSKIQATQFLTHATFGPTQVEIDLLASRMREIGTLAAASEWIENQTNTTTSPATFHQPMLESMVLTDVPYWSLSSGGTANSTNAYLRQRYRQFAWWQIVISSQDQLRQRVAWALAQVFPVNYAFGISPTEGFESTVAGGPTQKSRYFGVSNFYDVFVQNAFSNYREVLGRVTYHSIMGNWLSYRGNRRAQNGVYPDENFAREVMQLFSIGLYLLSDDGVRQVDGMGVAIPTYDADDIRETAEVFTGLGYGYGTYAPSNTSLNRFSPYTGAVFAQPNANWKAQVPMRMAPEEHDRSTKYLIDGITLTNSNGTDAIHTESSANAEIDSTLDILVNHQSCPPFIVHRLIQRLVKSNPSRAYIGRVVSVFKNNGQGQRGDLKAVVKAILLDPEAWQPIRVQYIRSPVNRFVVTTMGTEDCRLQEPVLNYTRFTRFFKATSQYQRATGASFASPTVVNNQFRLDDLAAELAQSPYLMPSVFNFYLPDFQPAGPLTTFSPSSRIAHGTIVAPEFQIVNDITSNRTGNFYRDRVATGNRTENHLIFNRTYTNTAGVITTNLHSTRTVVTYDFSSEQNLVTSEVGIESVLERLDLYLCGGTLSNSYKSIMRTALLNELALAGGSGNVSAAEALGIAQAAILSIVTSPSFSVTE
jgi:uncharacterized protein (DUF1800 family)